MKRRLTILSLLAIVSVLAAACVPAPAPQAATQAPQQVPAAAKTSGGTWVGATTPPTTLDPHLGIDAADANIGSLVYEPLVLPDATGKWTGVLATSWETSANGLTWTFHLRKGVKFHNGREMTADDVLFTFKRLMNKSVGAYMYSIMTAKVKEIKAPDPSTVVFELNGGGGTFLSELGLESHAAIIPNEAVNQDGTWSKTIGTGPFQFVEYRQNDVWRARRFDGYWGKVANIDQVDFKIISDANVAMTALKTGEIDWYRGLPLKQVQDLQKNPAPGVVVKPVYRNQTLRLSYNVTRPPFNDVRLRKAVNYAIDKQELADALWYGFGLVHNQPFLKDSPLYLDVPDPYAKADVEKAKALMKEAGVPAGFKFNVPTTAVWQPQWEYLQARLATVGITVNLEIVDAAQLNKVQRELNYDALLSTQGAIAHWDRPYGYFDKASSSNWLVGGYSNAAISPLLVQGRNETDLAKAKPIYAQIHKILQDDAAADFLGNEPLVQAWSTRVKGYEPNPFNFPPCWLGGGLNYITLDKR